MLDVRSAAYSIMASFALLMLSSCGGGGAGGALPDGARMVAENVCSAPTEVGHAMCHAIVRTDTGEKPAVFARESQALRINQVVPPGFGPDELARAYGYDVSGGSGQTIGIVDAYDNPNIEADLGVYRAHFNLPACTSANGCFKKVDQDGGARYPGVNATWAAEISVDIEMASAVCPKCKIVLVEASSDALSDLGAAVDQAVAQGATVVSNSFGTPEWRDEASFESHWNHPGVVITASTGDLGYGVQFPASSRYVVAVGGTHLQRSANARGYTEVAWSSAGAGCSAYIPKPAWQKDTGCPNRTVSDISFDASPQSPVAVYQSVCSNAVCGWTQFGGTSIAAPAIAGLYALAGSARSQHGAQALYSADPRAFADILEGSVGQCTVAYLCRAIAGYDGPTGLGTPIGLTAFRT